MEFFNTFGKPVFFVPGNWDKSFNESGKESKDPVKNFKRIHKMFSGKTNKYLTEGLENIYDCHFGLHKFPGFNIIGYGLSMVPEMPEKDSVSKIQFQKIKLSYEKLLNKIKKLYLKRNKSLPLIFLTHNVPFGTKLDLVKDKKSWAHGKHYGSKIAEDFIKRYNPLVCIGGHIHENFKRDKIKNTICINAGFGPDVNVTFEIEKGKIKNLKFLGKNSI